MAIVGTNAMGPSSRLTLVLACLASLAIPLALGYATGALWWSVGRASDVGHWLIGAGFYGLFLVGA